VDALEAAAKCPPADFSHQMGWVLKALQNAFHRLLWAESLEEGIIDTVRCGGDTDTNGCIAGALLGSVYALAAVPERWMTVLLGCRPNRPSEYHCSDILELAEALCGPRASGKPAVPFMRQ
jgi:ADP-ribosylglycohydrolase